MHANLRSKSLANVSEELLRLRAHEKLQAFVANGLATKAERRYKGVPKILKEFLKAAAEHNTRTAAG